MLNPNKKNFVLINSILFQFALSNATFLLFFASYKLIILNETVTPSYNTEDLKHFWTQYPLLIMITLSANRFPLFSFLGTIFENMWGFRK